MIIIMNRRFIQTEQQQQQKRTLRIAEGKNNEAEKHKNLIFVCVCFFMAFSLQIVQCALLYYSFYNLQSGFRFNICFSFK